MSRRAWLVALALVACGPKPGPRFDLGGGGAAKTGPGKIGDACKPVEDKPQANCGDGLTCMAGNGGGVCTAQCPCDKLGGTCAETAKVGEMCLKSCTADTDCRKDDGFTCDAQWKVCTQANLLSPKAPICDAKPAAPAKKTWGKSQQISTAMGAGIYNFEPSAAIDRDGDVVAVYINGMKKGAPNSLGDARVDMKDTIDGDHELKLPQDNHWAPWLVSDQKGKLWLAYLAFDAGRKNMAVDVVTSDDKGKTWSAPVAAFDAKDCPPGTDNCIDKPMIAIGPNIKNPAQEDEYVFYWSETAGAEKVVHSTDDGKTWSASTVVGKGSYGNALVTASGRVHVVFESPTGDTEGNRFGDATNGIFYVSSADGGATFSPPVKVSADNEKVPYYFSNPSIGADATNGILYVAYPSGSPDAKWDINLAWSADGGKTWKRTTVNDEDPPPCANHMIPTMTVQQDSGRVHIMWLDDRAGTGEVAYSHCDATVTDKGANVKCTPNETISDAPFASYDLVRWSPKWLGEYNALLLDAKHKTMHAIWTQTVDESGTPVARVFHASAKLPR